MRRFKLLRLLLLSTVAAIYVQPVKADPIITPLVAAAIGSATAGISIGAATITYASIISGVLTTGALYGLSMLFAPSPAKAKLNPSQLQVKQSMPEAMGGFGVTKVGGAKFFYETSRGALVDGIIHCASSGFVDGVDAWFLNDTNSGLPSDTLIGGRIYGGAAPAKPFNGKVQLETHLGTLPEASSPTLQGLFPGTWTVNHRLDGLCYTVTVSTAVKAKEFQTVYAQGAPVTFLYLRMFRVYDPRDPAQDWNNPDTFKFSKNPALCILFYLTQARRVDPSTGYTSYFGFGINKSRINLESFRNFASVCSTAVLKKDGSLRERYQCGGTFNMATDEKRTVLARLMATCDADIYIDQNGLVAIRGGVWEEPTVTIDDSVIEGYKFTSQNDAESIFNALTVSFSDPNNDYQIVPGDPYIDYTLQERHKNTIPQDMSLPYVQDYEQSVCLAKIATRKANPEFKLELLTKLGGLDALGQKFINVRIKELMIDTTVEVTKFVEMSDGEHCTISVSQIGPDAFDFDPALEAGNPPAVAKSTSVETTVPQITNLRTEVIRTYTGSVVTGLQLVGYCDVPSDPNFILRGQYRAYDANETDEDANYQDMTPQTDTRVISANVSDATLYEVRFALQGPLNGKLGAYTGAIDILATADPTAPTAPQSLTIVSSDVNNVRLSAQASESANNRLVRLYRKTGATGSFGTATLIGDAYCGPNQIVELTDSQVSADTYLYWVTSVNGSGVASAPFGPLKVIVV